MAFKLFISLVNMNISNHHQIDCILHAGVAVGKEGNIFFVDGTRVRSIGSDGNIANYIGTAGPPKFVLEKRMLTKFRTCVINQLINLKLIQIRHLHLIMKHFFYFQQVIVTYRRLQTRISQTQTTWLWIPRTKFCTSWMGNGL